MPNLLKSIELLVYKARKIYVHKLIIKILPQLVGKK